MIAPYHRLMVRWHGWRLRREVARMKREGRRRGLPPLDGYTDEAIAEGLRRLHDRKVSILTRHEDRVQPLMGDDDVRVTMEVPLDARGKEIAALRDRLARAETEREALHALIIEWEYQDSTRSIQYRDDLHERWLAALAPTDGAARMRELEENARAQHAELAESVATTNALIGEQMEVAKLLREIKYSALAGVEGRNVTSYEAGLKDALSAAETALRIVEDTPATTDSAARAVDAAGDGGETHG